MRRQRRPTGYLLLLIGLLIGTGFLADIPASTAAWVSSALPFSTNAGSEAEETVATGEALTAGRHVAIHPDSRPETPETPSLPERVPAAPLASPDVVRPVRAHERSPRAPPFHH